MIPSFVQFKPLTFQVIHKLHFYIIYFRQEVQLEDIFLFEDNPNHKYTELCQPEHQKHEVTRRVLVEGAPGSGKSTLCRKLAFDWANPPENKYWIHRFELVFLIEVRHLMGKIQKAIFEQLLPFDIEKCTSCRSFKNVFGNKKIPRSSPFHC